MSKLKNLLGFSRIYKVLDIQKKLNHSSCGRQPHHLICFDLNWTAEQITNLIHSAISLKLEHPSTNLKELLNYRDINEAMVPSPGRYRSLPSIMVEEGDGCTRVMLVNGCCRRGSVAETVYGRDVLEHHKVMILSEVNEPVLESAVMRAALFLGAQPIHIQDKLLWEHDYYGRIFSFMAEAIFCSTSTHGCVNRMANMSHVPVICMKSRTNAHLESLAIMMTILEELGQLRCMNISYIGQPCPILNTLLLLCAMMGCNIRVKCCDKGTPTSPLLLHKAQNYSSHTGTLLKLFSDVEEALEFANVIIAGPTAGSKKVHVYHFDLTHIANSTRARWIFIHCLPRGLEVNDMIFYGKSSRTFNVFYNMQYIAAALMLYSIKGHYFCG